MAILSRKNYTDDFTAEYTGMVVGKTYRDLQIMSDVYERGVFAVVYDPAKDECREIYVCNYECQGNLAKVEVDATPEVLQAYADHLVRQERHRKAVDLWDRHNRRIYGCQKMRVTVKEYDKLRRLGVKAFDTLFDLLSTKNFRSAFRESMSNQVRAWLKDENPKYKYPLSPKQMDCIAPRPYWGYRR